MSTSPISLRQMMGYTSISSAFRRMAFLTMITSGERDGPVSKTIRSLSGTALRAWSAFAMSADCWLQYFCVFCAFMMSLIMISSLVSKRLYLRSFALSIRRVHAENPSIERICGSRVALLVVYVIFSLCLMGMEFSVISWQST